MNPPTEAELFADVIEYRAALEVLRVFDVGHIVTISRAHSGDFPAALFFKVTIDNRKSWTAESNQCRTLQEAAEQARDRAYALMARAETLMAELNSAAKMLKGQIL